MNPDREKLATVTGWLLDLFDMTRGEKMSEEQKRRKVATLASWLSDDFGAWAFTMSSLRHVAGVSPFFPVYAELKAALNAWCAENRPPVLALAAPDGQEVLTGMDAYWLAFWHKRAGEGFVEGARDRLLSMIQANSERAYAAICRAEGIGQGGGAVRSAEEVRRIAATLRSVPIVPISARPEPVAARAELDTSGPVLPVVAAFREAVRAGRG